MPALNGNKTILFVMAPFISHLLPTYKMARLFREQGYTVVYTSTVKCEQHILKNGFLFQPSSVRGTDGTPLPVEELAAYLISKYKPALFLVEVSFWSWGLLLQGHRQKFMMIQTWPCCDKAPFLLTEGYRIVQKRNVFSYIKNELSWRRQNRQAGALLRSGDLKKYYDELVVKSGLDPSVSYISRKDRIGYFRVLKVPELILYPIEFDFPRAKKKHSWFVGPFIDLARHEPAMTYPDLSGSCLVFCSLGSMSDLFKSGKSFYERMIAAFRQRSDLTLIMSVGNYIKEIDLAALPSNIIVCEYAPQLNLLNKAAVFITQGGAGSVKEAIFFGVPMVIYPWVTARNSDQLGNADRVVYHHLGVLGDMESDGPPDILNRIDYVRNSKKIKASMGRMQSIYRRYANNEGAVIDSILRYAKK